VVQVFVSGPGLGLGLGNGDIALGSKIKESLTAGEAVVEFYVESRRSVNGNEMITEIETNQGDAMER
jgi:hypothetical protein